LKILEENFEFFENTSFFRHNLDDILRLRLAILFHDSGKGKCYFKDSKGIHFYGHSKKSAKNCGGSTIFSYILKISCKRGVKPLRTPSQAYASF